jgi:hypothetical protein
MKLDCHFCIATLVVRRRGSAFFVRPHHTSLMKTLILAITSVLVFQSQAVQAASPEEETRFIAAAKQAFEKHDDDALVALTCWDRVPDKLKKDSKQQYAGIIGYTKTIIGPPVTDIKLLNPDKSSVQWNVDDDPRFVEIDPAWKQAGVGYHSNLPVVKQLKVTFAPTKADDKTSLTIDVTYPLGEKDGKLYFIEPAPAK